MRYIYDITQLVHWPGNLTGIPRVMDEIALRFLEHSSENTVFVSWVKEVGEMCEVDFKSTRPHRGDGIDYIQNSSPSSAIPTSTSSLKKLKPTAKKVLKYAVLKTNLQDSRIYKRVKGTVHHVQALNYKVYTPKAGDKMFIPWGEWWDANWLNKIVSFSKGEVDIFPVCHDILPMVVPQFSGNSSSLTDFVRTVFPVSKTILVPSKSTKNDLIKWMRQQKSVTPPIEVVAWGEDFDVLDTEKFSDSEIQKKYSIKKDSFIVTVSTIEPRKNHTLLYYTYKLALSRGITPPKLLIIGRVGHDTSQIIKFIKEDPEIREFITICDYVNDAELNWLYSNCLFTISASFYEGLGMSILESIMRGKPGVCSNTSSLGELSDKYVLHFNPASTDECLEAIMKMSDPVIRDKYIQNIKRYSPKSWDDTYKTVVKIMETN